MLEPDVETRPWAEQLALDDARYRAPARLPARALALLPREARRRRDRRRQAAGGLDGDRRAAADGEGRAARVGHAGQPRRRPPVRDAATRSCGSTPRAARPARRATSRSPRAISRTGSSGSARSYARLRRRRRPAHRLAPTTPARSPPARRSASFDRIGLCHVPVGTGNTERLLARDRAAAARGGGADALVRRVPRRVGGRPRDRPRRLERRARARRRRAGRRRARVPRPPRGGLGRARDRGDGDRRHRRVALGRVRAAGRDAPRRPRARPRRADRPGDRRAGRARRRRDAASSS